MALQNSDAAYNGFNSAVRDAWLSSQHMPLFTQRSPFFKMMQAKGRIKPAGYGITMREPLMVPVLTGPQLEGMDNSFSTVEAQAMTGFTTANYVLSRYRIPVAYDNYQDLQAGGPEEMVRWREAILKNALLRSYNKVLSHFWAVPENTKSAGARDQLGSIRTFINGGTTAATDGGADPPAQAEQSAVPIVSVTSTTAVTLVGGIERSAAGAAYWCPPLLLGGSTTSAGFTVMLLNDLYEAAFQEGEEPDIMIMGGGNGGQMYGESRLAKLGFSAIRYRNAEITVDRRCPTAGFNSATSTAKNNHIYCLNLDHLTLRMDGKKPKFKTVPTTADIDQEVGFWSLALTADHLGNVHSLGVNYIQ
jgi:hypothetical protein